MGTSVPTINGPSPTLPSLSGQHDYTNTPLGMNSFAMRDNWAHGGNMENFFKHKDGSEVAPPPGGNSNAGTAQGPAGSPLEERYRQISSAFGKDSSVAQGLKKQIDAQNRPTAETQARVSAFDSIVDSLRRRRAMSALLTGGQGVLDSPSTSQTSLVGG